MAKLFTVKTRIREQEKERGYKTESWTSEKSSEEDRQEVNTKGNSRRRQKVNTNGNRRRQTGSKH